MGLNVVFGCWFANNDLLLIEWFDWHHEFARMMTWPCWSYETTSLMDLVYESRFGLNKINWRFLLSGFVKADSICEAKVTLISSCMWLRLGLIQSTIKHYKFSLLCNLNPGIFPLFESCYLHSRVLPFLQLWSTYIFISSAITCLRFELESTRTKSLDDNPIPLYYSGVRVL